MALRKVLNVFIILILCMTISESTICGRDKIDHVVGGVFLMNALNSSGLSNPESAAIIYIGSIIKEITDATGFDVVDLAADALGVTIGRMY